jgi:hypothetical protein
MGSDKKLTLKDLQKLGKEKNAEFDAIYQKWIDEHYPTMESALGKCQSATKEMQKAFPWLIRARGLAHTLQGEFPHWWLECPIIQMVVDPTQRQFIGISAWEELPDDDPRCVYPRQKCMNCGEEFYSDKNACSDHCYKELVEWLG